MRRALLLAVLAITFVLVSQAVAAGVFDGTDARVAAAMRGLWTTGARLPGQAVAVLGGLEVTIGLGAILFSFLWQAGYRIQSLAVLALPLGVGLEVLYKNLVFHPAPSHRFAHADGPSVTDLFRGAEAGNSFPSGHVVRSVIVYGLAAFIVYRLAEREWRGRLAAAAAAVIVAAISFDRVYLGVHWLSDVVGGLLLGSVCLLVSMFWMDLAGRLSK